MIPYGKDWIWTSSPHIGKHTKDTAKPLKNFYYLISNQALSTDIDLISIATLDDLALGFSMNEVLVDPIDMSSTSLLNQNQDLDDDSFLLVSDNDEYWYWENFNSFSLFDDDDMSQNTPFTANTARSSPTVNTQHSEIPPDITINSTTSKLTEMPINLPKTAENPPASRPKPNLNALNLVKLLNLNTAHYH